MFTVLLLIAAVTLAVVYLLPGLMKYLRVKKAFSHLPKVKGSLPFFGVALQLAKGLPWVKMENFLKDSNYEMTFMEFMFQAGILLGKPSHIRHVFDKNQRNYVKDTFFSYRPFMDILGDGVITSVGHKWQTQRKLVAGAFRREVLEETADVAKRAVDRLSARLEDLKGKKVAIEMGEQFRLLTLEVIGEVVLSLEPEESAKVFPDLYLPIVHEANLRILSRHREFLPTPSNFKYQSTVKRLNEYLFNLIKTRWEKRQETLKSGGKIERYDILERIFNAIDPKDFNQATIAQLTDEMKTFMFAGHETSAAMMTWTLYETFHNPEIQKKMAAEGETVFGPATSSQGSGKDKFENVKLPSTDELTKLTYTVNAMKEALRIYSLVPVVTRVAVEDDVIDGVKVPAGSLVFLNLKAVHWNPENWANPSEYKPERFEADYDPYTFLPFIQGPRNCLGQHLALLESRIVLSLLVRRFKFVPVNDKIGEIDEFLVPVCPKNGLNYYIE